MCSCKIFSADKGTQMQLDYVPFLFFCIFMQETFRFTLKNLGVQRHIEDGAGLIARASACAA